MLLFSAVKRLTINNFPNFIGDHKWYSIFRDLPTTDRHDHS